MQNQQARVLNTFASSRYARNVIYSTLYACVSIQVVTELDTHAFAPFNQIVAGETLCAIETHVFKKMSKSSLIIIFLQTSNFLYQIETRSIFWPVVISKVVGHAIVQRSFFYATVNRN